MQPTSTTVDIENIFLIECRENIFYMLPAINGRKQVAVTLRFYPSQADVLNGTEITQAILRASPAVPGLFHPAERRHHVRDQPGVYTNQAKIESLSDAPDSTDVATVEIARQAVRSAIGQFDSLTFIL